MHRLVWRETLLALLVLSLAFLNFGHSSVAFASDGHVVVTGTSFCGNPLMPDAADHVSCHACRIGNAADLPPPPVLVVPVAFAVAPVAYAAPVTATGTRSALTAARPRAPPIA